MVAIHKRYGYEKLISGLNFLRHSGSGLDSRRGAYDMVYESSFMHKNIVISSILNTIAIVELNDAARHVACGM